MNSLNNIIYRVKRLDGHGDFFVKKKIKIGIMLGVYYKKY